MKKVTLLASAVTLGFAAFGAQAADNFAGVTLGKANDNIRSSSALKQNLDSPNLDGVIHHDTSYGIRAGQTVDNGRYYGTYEYLSGSNNGYKLRQQNLYGSYDVVYPVNNYGTKVFGGGSLGLTKLESNRSGISRDSDIGYLIGAQVGVLQQVAENAEVEAGYRYTRSNASTEMSQHGGEKLGSLDLHSTEQLYLGVNYKF
ncbi:hypothetical protein [Pseudomonas sp. Marseille-QA0892]